MSKQTNKYILLFGLFVTIATSLGFLAPKPVEAGGSPTDGGTVGSLCYDSGTQNVQVLSVESSRAACRNSGFTVVEPGQPVPRPICVVGGAVQALDGNASSRTGCTQGGGTVVEAGQALPGFVVPTEAPSKNNESAPNSPEPITDAERQALADCGSNGESAQACLSKNPLVKWTLYAINFLAAGVGVVVTIMIIIGGIQYASAGPNPQQVQAAKKKIANALIALVAFFFLYAFMQYLVPGGIF